METVVFGLYLSLSSFSAAAVTDSLVIATTDADVIAN